MSDHEHDEDENCIIPADQNAGPNWSFSLWDIAGIIVTTLAGLFGVICQGLNLIANELSARANYGRDKKQVRIYNRRERMKRAEMSNNLRALVDGDS